MREIEFRGFISEISGNKRETIMAYDLLDYAVELMDWPTEDKQE